MPVLKQDAEKALKLLQNYHDRLNKPQDLGLRLAIQRVITTMGSDLFRALLDIQEYYEVTLLQDESTKHGGLHAKIQNGGVADDKAKMAEARRGLNGTVAPVPIVMGNGLRVAVQQLMIADDARLKKDEKYSEDDEMACGDSTITRKTKPKPGGGSKKCRKNGHTPSSTLNGSVSSSCSGGGKHAKPRPHRPHPHHHHHHPHGGLTNGHSHLGEPEKKESREGVSNPAPPEELSDSESDTSSTTTSGTSSSYTVSAPNPTNTTTEPLETNKNEIEPDIILEIEEMPPDMPTHITRTPSPQQGDLESWQIEEIILNRDGKGLGFSISGGVDNYVPETGTDVIVTKLIPGGLAIQDGRLKVGDVILGVNEVNMNLVTHEEAVDALRNAGSIVRLRVKRKPLEEFKPDLHYITLTKGNLGLGFSISGGIDNEHIAGDPGIYVTKIIMGGAADVEGTLRVGDKLLKVNDVNLARVTHEDAVLTLKALPNDRPVVLTVSRSLEEQQKLPLENGEITYVNGDVEPSIDQVDRVTDYMMASKSDSFSPMPARQRVSSPLITELKEKLKLIDTNNNPTPNGRENVLSNGLEEKSSKLCSQQQTDASYNSDLEERLKACYPGELIKTVILQRGPKGLGFNIVGGEDLTDSEGSEPEECSNEYGIKRSRRRTEYGIYVSHVVPGGAAHACGDITKGDQILAVNGQELTQVTHDEAALILKGVGDKAMLYLIHKPEEFQWYEARMNQVKEKSPEEIAPEQRTITAISNNNCVGPNLQNSPQVPGSLKTSQKRSIYVRALFDYDPAKDKDLPNRGLEFSAGDLLHVLNASDPEWWQACKCRDFTPALSSRDFWIQGPPTAQPPGTPSPPGSGGSAPHLGLIPSKQRVERKERIRNKCVKFRGSNPEDPNDISIDSANNKDKKRKNFSFTKKFPFMKSKEYLLNMEETNNHIQPPTNNSGTSVATHFEFQHSNESMPKPSESELSLNKLAEDQAILSYQLIVPKPLPYTRPVIILGPFKDRINDDLINENPDKFGSCVPHTTRSKREHEVDGRDYHFVASVKDMETAIQNHLFIEAGQYNGNLYGTSISAVKEIAQSGKHCVLDVSGNAIKRLISADIYPIVIYIKPESPQALMALNDKMTEEEAIKACEKAQKIEQDFSSYFTGVIHGKSFEDIHSQVLRLIDQNSDMRMWVVSDEVL